MTSESTAFIYIILGMGILALVLRIVLTSTPEQKGAKGEEKIERALMRANPKDTNKRVLRNLYVPTNKGYTREIDLLFLTTKGIVVIESKNYAGYIFGDEQHKDWTATYNAGKKGIEKHHFFNPVWQNNAHIKALREYLKSDVPMFSLIVFSDRCEIKSLHYTSDNVAVCYRQNLITSTQKLLDKSSVTLSQNQVDIIANQLSDLTDSDGTKKQAHISSLNKRYSNNEVCPWCGAKLVIRTAKQGANAGKQFYGCSNYPNCKYTKSIIHS